MVHAVTAVIIMIAILLLYGAIMLFTEYFKVATYFKAMLINFAWFYFSLGYSKFDIYYPTIFENKWLNFLIMSMMFLLIAFEISKYPKLRNAFIISTGTVIHIALAVLILNFCGGAPGWMTAVYIGVSSCIIVGIFLIAIYGGKNTEPSSFMSRLLAGILAMPSPFIIVSSCMVTASSNRDMIIESMSFEDFIYRLYDFLKDPDFNYTGNFMYSGLEYNRKILLVSLIVTISIFALYLIIDSTYDYRHERRIKINHKKESEKERIRAEISSRIHSQLQKIDACMSYISTNYKLLKVDDEEMKQLRLYYDEATRIKYTYNGEASGPVLKRLTEIKTEMFIIRDHIVNRSEAEKKPQNDKAQEEKFNSSFSENKEEQEQNLGLGFFNGCNTAEELKKRYRDLTKVFHPDSENGDQETFMLIKSDYEALAAKFESSPASS